MGDTTGASGLERYGETLTPVIGLWSQPEWAYLRTELLAGFDINVGAVAGEFGLAAIVNPTGSNRIFVVERLSAFAAVQTSFLVTLTPEGVIAATAGVTAAPLSLDTRWRDRVTGADRVTGLIYSGTDAVGLAGRVERFTTPAGGANYGYSATALPIVMGPGWGVACVSGTVNLAIQVEMRYRERTVLPGELE